MTGDAACLTSSDQTGSTAQTARDDVQSVRRTGKIRISEIFGPTVQGEGALLGMPTVFVRTILARIKQLSHHQPILITLSGGNPAIQPLEALIDLGKPQGFTFAIETQGSIARQWFAKLDHLTLSPKPPSSGTVFNADDLAACIDAARKGGPFAPAITLKFPVADENDLALADQVRRIHRDIPCYLQPVNATPAAPHPDGANGVDLDALTEKYRWLVDQVSQRGWFDVRVMPQWHVHVWGNLRGV